MEFKRSSLILPLSCLALVACGGGGSSSDSGNSGSSSDSGNSDGWQRSTNSLALTRANSDALGKATVADLVQGISMISESVYFVNDESGVPDFKDMPTDSETLSCSDGGTYKISVSASSRSVTQTYKNCTEDGYKLNGSLTMQITAVSSANKTYSVKYSFDDYIETLNGEVTGSLNGALSADLTNTSNGWVAKATSDYESIQPWADAQYYSDLEYTARLVVMSYYGSRWYRGDFSAVSGTVDLIGAGSAALTWNAADSSVNVSSSGSGHARLALQGDEYTYTVTADNGRFYATRMVIQDSIYESIVNGEETSDLYFYDVDYRAMDPDEAYQQNLVEIISSSGFDLYDVSVSMSSVDSNDDGSPDVDSNTAYSISVNEGVLTLSGDPATYTVSVGFANMNNVSDSISITVSLDTDTDGDSIANRDDFDDDNDGVYDYEDAYPLDGTEWADTDNDGIGDNADTDDDGDGYADTDDVLPNDSRCGQESDLVYGSCLYDYLDYDSPLTMDEKGVVYFRFDEYGQTIYRFDSVNKKTLTPIVVPDDFSFDNVLYSEEQKRLYLLSYSNTDIGYVENPAANTELEIMESASETSGCGVIISDDWLMIGSLVDTGICGMYAYDLDGNEVWSGRMAYADSPARGTWDQDTHTMYHRSDDGYWLRKLSIPADLSDFTIAWQEQSDNVQAVTSPVYVVANAGLIVDAAGHVFKADTMEYVDSLDVSYNNYSEKVLGSSDDGVYIWKALAGQRSSLQFVDLVGNNSNTQSFSSQYPNGIYHTEQGDELVYIDRDSDTYNYSIEVLNLNVN